MPQLQAYGRRWHIATDVIPVPALIGALLHVIWLVVFGPLTAHYDILSQNCKNSDGTYQGGVQLQIVCGAFIVIYALCLLWEVALAYFGFQGTAGCRKTRLPQDQAESHTETCSCATWSSRLVRHSAWQAETAVEFAAGTPLEISKRWAVVPILYVMSVIWFIQIAFVGESA